MRSVGPREAEAGVQVRPTDYRPEFCEMVVEWGKQGKSRTWMATELDVHRDTLYAWEKSHPEFSDALARAKQFEQRWWEDEGQGALRLQGYQSSMWSRSMAARFPDEWRESTKQEQTVNGNMSITIATGVPRE